MKKLLLILLVLSLFAVSVSAAPSFSTIQMIGNSLGLQMPSQVTGFIGELNEAQNTLLCFNNPFDCATSQITGQLTQEAYGLLPDNLKKVYGTYSQIKSYSDQVAGVIGDLQVNDDTGSLSGCLKTKDQLKNTCMQSMSIQFNESTKQTKYEFTDKSGVLSFKAGDKENNFTNIKPKDNKTSAYVNVDEKGNVINADLTTNEKGSVLVFNNQKVNVPPNTRVVYEDGKVTMYNDKNSDINFEFTNIQDGKEGIPQKYVMHGQGEATWTGNGLEVTQGTSVTDTDLGFSVKNNNKDLLFLTGNKADTTGYSNYVVASKNNFEFSLNQAEINIFKSNKLGFNVTTDTGFLDIKVDKFGSGILENNQLKSVSGSFDIINCDSDKILSTQIVEQSYGEQCTDLQLVTSDNKFIDDNVDVQACSFESPTGAFSMILGMFYKVTGNVLYNENELKNEKKILLSFYQKDLIPTTDLCDAITNGKRIGLIQFTKGRYAKEITINDGTCIYLNENKDIFTKIKSSCKGINIISLALEKFAGGTTQIIDINYENNKLYFPLYSGNQIGFACFQEKRLEPTKQETGCTAPETGLKTNSPGTKFSTKSSESCTKENKCPPCSQGRRWNGEVYQCIEDQFYKFWNLGGVTESPN